MSTSTFMLVAADCKAATMEEDVVIAGAGIGGIIGIAIGAAKGTATGIGQASP